MQFSDTVRNWSGPLKDNAHNLNSSMEFNKNGYIFYDSHPIGGIHNNGWVIICFVIVVCVYQLLNYDKKKYTSACCGI